VSIVSVGCMDVCRRLEDELMRLATRGGVPTAWVSDESLCTYDTLQDVVGTIRDLSEDSDDLLNALLARSGHDPLAVSTIAVALCPLALRRCADRRDRVDELVGELVIAVGEAAAGGLPPSRRPRRMANRLLDRAWGRVRLPARRVTEPVVHDPVRLGTGLADRGPAPETVAVERVALGELRRFLAAPGHGSLARAWNTAVSLAEAEERSRADRIRLSYARKVLRRSLGSRLVA
jgi:hypothetical protein